MVGRLETGIEILDRRLEGGIPPGSIVVLAAPPGSQAELLLYELTAARGSLYLTTERTQQAVRDTLERTDAPVGDPTIRDIPNEDRLEQANRLFRALPQGANLILDTADPLERSEPDRYRNFLNELREHMVETDSVAFVHCLRGHEDHVPRNRDTTLHIADVVFDLTTTVRGTDLEVRLTVPKFRGGSALSETIKLEIADRVAIDTSRDIA
jgi:KaiC/GvpD/RAD55 family RecA-like ATPase